MFNPNNYEAPFYSEKQIGTTADGKPIVQPYLTDKNYLEVLEIYKDMLGDDNV